MNKTILIAHDDNNVLAGLEFLLTEEGYTVIQAASPAEVANIANRQNIDLLLTEIGRASCRERV